jgi:xanthine dehydrogenase accessory factor
MKELNDIILAYDKAVLQNKQMALATVVKVDGSSYRRPGAKMLVTEDGQLTGVISGGCLEGDALRKAQFAMFEQKNRLEIYDTTDDEDNKLGVQLGCNGIVYILFEPIKTDDENNPVNLLRKIARMRKDAVLVTVFNENKTALQIGTWGFVSTEKSFFKNDDFQSLKTDCIHVLNNKSSLIKHIEGNSTVLLQFVPPVIQLIIVGAGNDAQPLVEIASLLGWNTIIIDGRPAHANRERFPKANHVLVSKPSDILSAVHTDEQTAVVLMTHNYYYDLAALEKFIHTNCNYMGVLGPKKKLHKMLDELRDKGVQIGEQEMHKIYGPVGLDIGAETSEEIALSIVAEVKAVFSNRPGSHLKQRSSEIHNHNLTLKHE